MHEEKLFQTMLSEELTLEGLIRDIVQNEGMDPWNIDIVILTNKYMEILNKMKEFDIKVSGKFLLAAAILLKMKSDYLIPQLIEVEEESVPVEVEHYDDSKYDLEPHIPVPKSRKITMDELIESLRKALVVKQKRSVRHSEREVKMNVRVKTIYLSEKIKNLYIRITDFFKKLGKKDITFSQLIPSRQKKDLIWTFIPLVHLANRGKISLTQEKNFGEINVRSEESED
ncbi:MAG TPA: hypothetical protein ENN30_02320 [Candidatus Woesearchaeota archaeon]|nr:hypothetical protein [Candidatus Woesearchaeota archaeon]